MGTVVTRSFRADSTNALSAALRDPQVAIIEVAGTIEVAETLALQPGQQLIGHDADARLRFAPGQDGVRLSTDSQVRDLRLETTPERRAVYNEPASARWGRSSSSD